MADLQAEVQAETKAETPAAQAPAPVTPAEPATVRALAKPPVRRLAKDLGISLSGLAGTGPLAARAGVSGTGGARPSRS